MVFDEALGEVVTNVEGARGAMIVGRDGMVVAWSGEEGGTSYEALAAAYADLVRKVAVVGRDTGTGDPSEFVARSRDATIVWRDVDGEYGLLAVLRPDGSLGRARYELGRAADRIRPEL